MRLAKTLALCSIVLLTACVERHVEEPAQYPDDPSLGDQFGSAQVSAREPSNVEVPYETSHHGKPKPVNRRAQQTAAINSQAYQAEPIDPGSNVPMDPPQPDELEG